MTEELRCEREVDEGAVQKPQELQVHPRKRSQLWKQNHKEKALIENRKLKHISQDMPVVKYSIRQGFREVGGSSG